RARITTRERNEREGRRSASIVPYWERRARMGSITHRSKGQFGQTGRIPVRIRLRSKATGIQTGNRFPFCALRAGENNEEQTPFSRTRHTLNDSGSRVGPGTAGRESAAGPTGSAAGSSGAGENRNAVRDGEYSLHGPNDCGEFVVRSEGHVDKSVPYETGR